jgi:hypothetical protein
VTRLGNDDQRTRAEAVDEAATERRELGVVLTGQHQHRHRDLAEAVPQRFLRARTRRPEAGAEPDAVLRRRSARRAVASVSPANSGLASHSSMNCSTHRRTRCGPRGARRPLGAPGAPRASSMPAVAPISTSRSHLFRCARAACSATRPPIEYPTYVPVPPGSTSRPALAHRSHRPGEERRRDPAGRPPRSPRRPGGHAAAVRRWPTTARSG